MAEMAVTGVVGLGAMGRPITGHLLGAGFEVCCYDLQPETLAQLAKRGARVAGSPQEVAERSAAVLLFVPSDDDVLDVCGAGLLASARPGTIVALCSSVRPETCHAVAAAAPPGVDVLDGALTGGVRGAEQGRINLLVGGDEAVLDRLRPVLAPWTSTIHHLGGLGAGSASFPRHLRGRWTTRSASCSGASRTWGSSQATSTPTPLAAGGPPNR